MAQPESDFVSSLTKTYWEKYGVVIDFIGSFQEETPGNPPQWISAVITELVSNCPAAREVDDFVDERNTSSEAFFAAIDEISSKNREHPHRIKITSALQSVNVSDDVDQTDPDESMGNIQRAIDSPFPGMSTRKRGGGVGIHDINKSMLEHDGKLSYKVQGRRIVATASWTK